MSSAARTSAEAPIQAKVLVQVGEIEPDADAGIAGRKSAGAGAAVDLRAADRSHQHVLVRPGVPI
jgi:hypothetical protein